MVGGGVMLRALIQAGKENLDRIRVSPEGKTVSTSGETFVARIYSNKSWEVFGTLPDWATVKPSNGEKLGDITVSASGNDGDDRSASIGFQTTTKKAAAYLTVFQSGTKTSEVETDKPGSPNVTRDKETGEITKYEYTTTPVSLNGNTSENTGFVPFSGGAFRIKLKAKLNTGNSNYATLIHALQTSNNGGYEGFIVRFQGITVISATWRLVIGSQTYSISNANGKTKEFLFEYSGGVLKTTIDGTVFNTSSMNLTSDDINLWVGSDSGGNNKVSAEIQEFKVERL